jgi:alkylated DNA repair dioxygenase AlkB
MIDDLFSEHNSDNSNYIRIDLGDAELHYYTRFLDYEAANRAFHQLKEEVNWRQEFIEMYGTSRPIPRLSAWYGDQGVGYEYSGIDSSAQIWTPELNRLKCLIEQTTHCTFNGVLANLYRGGSDSVAWHSDDEVSLGPDPVVASLSLGETRRFQLKHKTQRNRTYQLDLAHGSLLMMMQGTQRNWQHQVPKTRRPVSERINLTFRRIV